MSDKEKFRYLDFDVKTVKRYTLLNGKLVPVLK